MEEDGKPGLVGIVTGTIAGLATITPASGSVGPLGAIIIGASAGIICYYACGFIKEKLGVDDSLDVAAVHGIGGILGTLLVSYLGVGGTFGGLGINKETASEQLAVQSRMFGRNRIIRGCDLYNRQSSGNAHRWNPSFRRRRDKGA